MVILNISDSFFDNRQVTLNGKHNTTLNLYTMYYYDCKIKGSFMSTLKGWTKNRCYTNCCITFQFIDFFSNRCISWFPNTSRVRNTSQWFKRSEDTTRRLSISRG